MPGRSNSGPLGGQRQPTPQRSPLDVVGRANDLINAYLVWLGQFLRATGPIVLMGMILLMILYLSARELIKE